MATVQQAVGEHNAVAPRGEGSKPSAVQHHLGRARARGARPRARSPRSGTPSGSRPPTGATRSSCSRSRRRRGCPSSCRSATGGCSSRRSRSTAARRTSMAADLAATPRTGLHVQLCGDAHLSNFGAFAAPDRQLVFDLNDFDETLPGPVRVGREAARRELRGRRPRPRVRRPTQRGAINRDGDPRVPRGDARVRRDANLDVWYARIDVESIAARAGAARRARRSSSGSSATSPRRAPRTACGRSRS